MESFSPYLTIILLINFITFFLVFRAIRLVPKSQIWIVERFGKYKNTLKPGLNFIIPFIDAVAAKISSDEIAFRIENYTVITKDNAKITANISAFYEVVNAYRAAYSTQSLNQALETMILAHLDNIIIDMELYESLSRSNNINEKLLPLIKTKSEALGLKINRVEISTSKNT